MQTRAELYDLLGYDGLRAIDKAAASPAPKSRRGGGRGRQR
jgi:hypothetical protein